MKRLFEGLLFWIVVFMMFGSVFSAEEKEVFRPLIGIPAPLAEKSISVDAAYVNAIVAAGGLPILIPQSENSKAFLKVMDLIDGLLLIGGEDLNPELYAERPSLRLETVNKNRDQFEWSILKGAVERKLPLLAICRGHQLITVFFGGTLYQDIPSEFEKPISHRTLNAKPYTCRHEVFFEPDCRLEKIYGVKTMTVNSQHHQSVKKIPSDFKPVAKTSDGGIEALESDRYPMILSIQWHPEQLLQEGDSLSGRIFAAFIDLARKKHSPGKNR